MNQPAPQEHLSAICGDDGQVPQLADYTAVYAVAIKPPKPNAPKKAGFA